MQLLTKTLEKKLPPLDSTTSPSSRVWVHYFNPTGQGDWYGLTYDPQERMFFGYVSLFGDWNDELGYFSLTELESFKGQMGLGIERDLHWDDTKTLEEVMDRIR